MKKKQLIAILVALATVTSSLSLSGCAKKFDATTSAEAYSTYMNNMSSVKYTANITLNLTAEIYGERIKMYWKSADSIVRMLNTGELSCDRSVSASVSNKEYDEKISHYVVGGKRYATYDNGNSYVMKDYVPNSAVAKGPFRVIDAIMNDSNATYGTEGCTYRNQPCNYVSGTLTGPYLPYLMDEINMTGLMDFKNVSSENVTFAYLLKVDKEDGHPYSLEGSLIAGDNGKSMESLMTNIVASADENASTNANVKIDTFNIFYDIEGVNVASTIELPENAADAKEVDNIESMSISATESNTMDEEDYKGVKVGDFMIEVPDSWQKADILDSEYYEGADSNGKTWDTAKLVHSHSESYIQVYNPVTLDKLIEKLNAGGINTEGAVYEGFDSEDAENPEVLQLYDLDKIKEFTVQYFSKLDYDSVRIDGEPSYIMSSKGDKKKEYDFIIFGGDRDYIEIKAVLDGAELYKEYYDEVINHLASSFSYNKTEVVETGKTEESTESTEGETSETTEGNEVESLVGTLRNPYKVNDNIEMRGIDLTSGNIINEYAVIKSINTDKLLVGQKLKESGLKENSKAALVNIVITTDKVKYTDESELDLVMSICLVDKDGKEIGQKLNDGKPLNKDLKDGIVFTSDNETKQVVFAFEKPDDFDENTALLEIKYNDPDLGDRAVYTKLK